ncbi:hypothetical protein SEA_DRYAD_109 [Streptomyces phage Dryad]|nr:hypothetical protein SEA_DRYAD_109 [Streptomyces phage Dryad]
MAMKMSNEAVHERIRKARATIAAGVRLSQPDLETRGRQAYAEAVIENTIRLYNDDLTSEARAALARILFDHDAEEDATADAEETTQEVEAEIQRLREIDNITDLVPVDELDPETLYDPDDEDLEDPDDEA